MRNIFRKQEVQKALEEIPNNATSWIAGEYRPGKNQFCVGRNNVGNYYFTDVSMDKLRTLPEMVKAIVDRGGMAKY